MKIVSVYGKKEVTSGITFTQPSMTQQHFKDECNINNIIARYEKTGFLTDPSRPATRKPQFGDFTSVLDYMAAQNQIIEAQDMFDSLPATMRKRFENDPQQLLAFLEDPANTSEAIDLGFYEYTALPSPVETVSEVVKTD